LKGGCVGALCFSDVADSAHSPVVEDGGIVGPGEVASSLPDRISPVQDFNIPAQACLALLWWLLAARSSEISEAMT